ncbi:hypothetical protein QTO30_21230 [Yoonia sp. GPGPB17]|uniref:hypothetical protein n=1 Tax=Yoonia sp. GPGPB17 TaxID=3026147 RepID=UPI0030BD5547
MKRPTTHMENVLGSKIAQPDELEIPGSEEFDSDRVLYFSVKKGQSARALFQRILNFSDPPNAQSGGAHEGGCLIETTTSEIFCAVRFRGDLVGWRKDIEQGAAAVGSELARIENGNLVTFDGRSFSLTECTIEFT